MTDFIIKGEKFCLNCEKEIDYNSHRTKKYKVRKYCSISCATSYRNKIDNPVWKDGVIDKIKNTLRNNPVRYWLGKKRGRPWNFNLTKENDERIKRYGTKGSISRKGHIPWNYKLTKETDERVKLLGLHSGVTRKIRGSQRLEKHHNWQNGKYAGRYNKEFNKELKEQIRQRDQFRCQQCFRHQDELFIKNKNGKIINVKLSIHHIDYDKKNNNPDNLISLCGNCHAQTNYDRNDWINYFNRKVM